MTKKALFLLVALVAAAYATTCWDLKKAYRNNSCCGQSTTKSATFDDLDLTCGDLRSSYTGSSCCSADLTQDATLNIQTCAPTFHTGNLALLLAIGSSCDDVAVGFDPTAGVSCENADGSDSMFELNPGATALEQIQKDCAVPSNLVAWGYPNAAACEVDNQANYLADSEGTCPAIATDPGATCYVDRDRVQLNLKAVCPEKCGAPCGHAPTVDIDAVAQAWGQPNCAALQADRGFCEADSTSMANAMLTNWFCGETCRGGAPYDECKFLNHPQLTALVKMRNGCAVPSNLQAWGYQSAAACEVEEANYLVNSEGNCDAGVNQCYVDDDLQRYGSTQANQCPLTSAQANRRNYRGGRADRKVQRGRADRKVQAKWSMVQGSRSTKIALGT